MTRPTPLALAIALAGTATSLNALAQQAERLDAVTVTGTVATKTETPFNETPQATSQVDREDWEQKGAETVQRALGYTAGVYANQVGASNRYDYIVLRGFSDGSLSNTFLDGLKLMGDANSYSSLVVDPYFLDSVEVVKGPASVLYGRASPGGVVSMTSKRPEFEHGGEIRYSAGSNNQRSAAFDLTGPLDDARRVAFRLTGKASAADTQFGPVEEKRVAIAPQLTWDITDATSLTLHAYLHQDPEGGYHSGVPYEGAVESRDGRRIDNNFFDGEDAYDKFERTQRMVGYDLEHRFNDSWTARQKLLYLNTDVTMNQVYGFGWANDTELNRYYSGGEESMEAWTLDNQLQAELSTGALDHTLLLGADYQHRENDVVWTSGAFPALDAFDPKYGAGPSSDIVTTNDETHELSQTGVYVQDQMSLDNWHLSLGGRYDVVNIENTLHHNDTTSELDDQQFSGRAGLLYAFDNGVSPYVSYSTSFTPTSFVDKQGDLLQPMKGEQWETGLKYQQPGTQNRYSVSMFHITQENVATKEQPTDPYRAIGEIESQGVELEAQTQLTDELSLQASYSFTDITYAKSDVAGEEGSRAIYAPRHQASLWGHYRVADGTLAGLGAGFGVRYRADIQADRANTEQVPDYTLVDAGLSYDFTNAGMDGVMARLNVNNLTDREYVASCNSLQYCYFGAERSVKATLSYEF
ncbi:TonB-dependent siderophore receptor [Halomonas almeriensis]|uniref:TonB-dependent siderophore receptor n=1 Tax=Halomonas almeriensis TaxID=308163 RepID=UPI0025B3E861|nr:TonB-dependent siderophore receptor [Halomonas almeriensis]MDN3553737.1 TonB-dependent siderophore receptor [Halomonas almeriensis]